jgi:hypothetical protein
LILNSFYGLGEEGKVYYCILILGGDCTLTLEIHLLHLLAMKVANLIRDPCLFLSSVHIFPYFRPVTGGVCMLVVGDGEYESNMFTCLKCHVWNSIMDFLFVVVAAGLWS